MEIRDLKSAEMSDDEFNRVNNKLKERSFTSQLNCFNDHFGIRKAELSTLLAPAGSGKSSFVRTIILELAAAQKPTYCFLSEEQVKFYVQPLQHALRSRGFETRLVNKALKNILFDCQYKMSKQEKDLDAYIYFLEETIKANLIEMIIIDNMTTSFMGRLRIDDQARAVEMLKEVAVKFNVAIFLVIHTAKGTSIYDRIVTGEDVRGNASTTNIGSYNYIISTFFRLDEPLTFLSVDKARYHSKSNKQMYQLFYDLKMGIFTKDEKSSVQKVEAIMSSLKKQKKQIEVGF